MNCSNLFVYLQHVTQTGQKKKYVIVSPPPYLILHIKRFTRNQFFIEKNHTIVNFPLRDLDLRDCLLFFFPTLLFK